SFSRDWSSDVCSSDLISLYFHYFSPGLIDATILLDISTYSSPGAHRCHHLIGYFHLFLSLRSSMPPSYWIFPLILHQGSPMSPRSEELRVGKASSDLC